MEERNIKGECWSCKNKRPCPDNTHISCAKPDPGMTGDEYGISEGWFYYPSCFDPTWKTKTCDNYEKKGE